jgi:uncharacterized membrane protein YfcA
MFSILLFLIAIAAGAVASVAGFGIGSLLTPFLATMTGTKLAVAAISIPHFIGTAIRFWRLRGQTDRRVLWSFGITSAVGGLLGALLQSRAASRQLTIVFGVLLIFVGISDLTGLAQRKESSNHCFLTDPRTRHLLRYTLTHVKACNGPGPCDPRRLPHTIDRLACSRAAAVQDNGSSRRVPGIAVVRRGVEDRSRRRAR